jgi:hypothetical protein
MYGFLFLGMNGQCYASCASNLVLCIGQKANICTKFCRCTYITQSSNVNVCKPSLIPIGIRFGHYPEPYQSPVLKKTNAIIIRSRTIDSENQVPTRIISIFLMPFYRRTLLSLVHFDVFVSGPFYS